MAYHIGTEVEILWESSRYENNQPVTVVEVEMKGKVVGYTTFQRGAGERAETSHYYIVELEEGDLLDRYNIYVEHLVLSEDKIRLVRT